MAKGRTWTGEAHSAPPVSGGVSEAVSAACTSAAAGRAAGSKLSIRCSSGSSFAGTARAASTAPRPSLQKRAKWAHLVGAIV